jgi:type IV pilus assembly protein PilO
MARRDLAAELSQKPLGFKLGILAGVLVVLGFFYWQFFYSSLADEQKALTSERSKLAKKETALKQREKEWIELLQKKEILDEQLTKNRVTLPASSELPAFFVHLQKQAASAGVTVVSWTRRKESAVETYVKVPVEMHITGTFYQINNYFRLLAQTDRIISIGGLNLRPFRTKNEEIILKASFNAMTFRQKDRPPDTTLGESSEGDGGEDASGQPARGSRAGAGRFADSALGEQEAVENETGDQAARETAPAPPSDAPAAGVDRIVDPGTGPGTGPGAVPGAGAEQ